MGKTWVRLANVLQKSDFISHDEASCLGIDGPYLIVCLPLHQRQRCRRCQAPKGLELVCLLRSPQGPEWKQWIYVKIK
jgi:hypothetical protein